MSNLLRLIVLVLALCVLGSTAVLLQGWMHRRAVDRHVQIEAKTVPTDPWEALRLYQVDQRRAAIVFLAVALGSLITVALMPLRRPEPNTHSIDHLREEMKNVEHLARTTVEQGAALVKERDVRQRVEENLQLQQRIVNRTLEEKIRLGRDLHDGMIQSLYATGLTLESTRERLRTDPEEAGKQLETSLQMINRTIQEVRTAITGLSPANVRKDNLVAVLRAIAEDIGSGRDVVFEYKVDDQIAMLISDGQLAGLMPVVSEGISNALRHGGARRVTLRLHAGDNALCLLVQDDGRGFQTTSPREDGHGLKNMRARAEEMGGTIQLSSTEGMGTRVVLTIPIQPIP